MKTEILVNGRPVREYNHEGRLYVEGRENSQYTIRLKNTGYCRVLAVVSVDGINVITGQPSTGNKDEAGYIIPAYGEYEVKGFRVNLSEVGAFKFSNKASSYAESKGEGANAGVIGVRFYTEKQKVIYRNPLIIGSEWTGAIGYDEKPYWYSTPQTFNFNDNSILRSCNLDSSSYSVQSEVKAQSFDLGTSWGSKVEDKVVESSFEADYLAAEHVLYYSSRQGLESMGIKIVPEKQVAFPKPFKNFCEPPPNWR